MSSYLLSIAEKIIQNSCNEEIYHKYNLIKQSISIRNSNANIQDSSNKFIQLDHSDTKLKRQRKSCTNLSLRETSNNAINKNSNTAKKQNSNNQQKQELASKPKQRKQSITGLSVQKQNSPTTIAQKSVLKRQQRSVSKSRQNIKSSILDKNITHLQNPLLTITKTKKYVNQNDLHQINSQLVTKRLFGDKKVPKISEFDNQISFNLNLNRMLAKVNEIVNQQSLLIQTNKSRNQSTLSRQNIQLLDKISKKLKKAPENNFQSGFRKNKQNKNAQANLKIQNGQGLSEYFKTIQLSDVNSPAKNTTTLKKADQRLQMQITQSDSDQRIRKNKCQANQKYKQLKFRMKQIKQDNKWLIQNVQNLLNQNQQLKSLLVQKR